MFVVWHVYLLDTTLTHSRTLTSFPLVLLMLFLFLFAIGLLVLLLVFFLVLSFSPFDTGRIGIRTYIIQTYIVCVSVCA